MPKWTNNTCNVCEKKIQKKAELCSSCRVLFEWIKNKHPENTYEKWIILTRQLIIDREKRRLERRKQIKD